MSMLLAQNGFGNSSAIHSHLLEQHRNVIELISKKQSLVADHLTKVEEKDRLISILKHNTPEQLLQIAMDCKMPVTVQLNQLVAQMFAAEQEYDFLRQERKKYEAEKEAERQAAIDRKRKMIPAFDVLMSEQEKEKEKDGEI